MRLFEVFGLIFLLIAGILAILMVTLRRKAIHTALTYVHGAAGKSSVSIVQVEA